MATRKTITHMDGELENLIGVWTVAVWLICYCYYVVSRIPKGILRLIFLFPVIYVFTILPLNLRSVHGCGTTTFFFTWLGNFKLFLFAFDLHHLLFPAFPSFFHFVAIICLPIQVKKLPSLKQTKPTDPSPQKMAETKSVVEKTLVFALKLLVLGTILRLYDLKQLQDHPYLVFVLYCVNLYLGVELVLVVFSLPARAIFGAALHHHFNAPYLSTSLQDFWGHRWNLMVPNILRLTVYNPTRNMLSGVLGANPARVLATIATFTVSGLVHELLYYYITLVSPTWEVTAFFVLHGVCTAAEVAAKKKLGGRVRILRAVSGPATLVFLIVTARWLMFAQLFRNGVPERAVGEYSIMANFVKAKILSFF